MIAASLLVVAPPHMVGEGERPLCVDVAREAPRALAGGAGVARPDAFVRL